MFFFFNDTATTEIYTLSLHDALPILGRPPPRDRTAAASTRELRFAIACRHDQRHDARHRRHRLPRWVVCRAGTRRSEEHTSELQSRQYLVCRLLLEKKKKN